MKKKHILLLLGVLFLILWFIPHSKELSDQAWHLFVIFLVTIIGVILKPLPIGAMSLLGVTAATFTNTISLENALLGFKNDIVWLVLLAFFISKGFMKTGLGMRIAYYFVSIFGKKTLGLSYGILASEVLLAPAIPSVTARSGGVIYPIVQGLSKTFGSDPKLKTEGKIGSFLILVAYQGSILSGTIFLTAMAANPFFAALTGQTGFSISWLQWFKAAVLPGILGFTALPYVIFKLHPPEIKETPDAPILALAKLKEMGRLSSHERYMLLVFAILLFLWIVGPLWSFKATTAAFLGLSLLIILGVLDWQEVIGEKQAWDTFFWFSILITLATGLNQLGFTPWLSERVIEVVHHLHWVVAFSLLALIYFYSHYFFASMTAHVGAMYPAFLLMAKGLGTPLGLAIFVFAFTSSLCGGLTHYGSGAAPVFFASGYVNVKQWWNVGFKMSIVNLVIWCLIGSLWWKILHIW